MWFAILGCIACFAFVGWHIYSGIQAEKEYEALRAAMEEAEAQRAAEQAAAEAAEEEAQSYTLEEIQNTVFTGEIEIDTPAPQIPEGVLQEAGEDPIDFEELQAVNSELYAWIRIPNTQIDYPIAQRDGVNQNFYLHHDMYQRPRYSGCIYTENLNKKDFTDPVTVIYGHNMKNGTMFQNLHRFRDEVFFEENPYVYIYTEQGTRVYEIFAAYPYDSRHILNSFDFTDREVLEKYLDDCMHPRSMEAHVREDAVVNADTPILTLSTCIGGQTEMRYLVQAVLVYDEAGQD